MIFPKAVCAVVVTGAMALCSGAAFAQGAGDYPNRPVTVVVAFAAGGPADPARWRTWGA